MSRFKINQNSHIKDCEGNYIKQGSMVEFIDRYEWYRCITGMPTKEDIVGNFEKYPRILRTIDLPDDYSWILDSEIQTHWRIVND
jgi:hypothetical protein